MDSKNTQEQEPTCEEHRVAMQFVDAFTSGFLFPVIKCASLLCVMLGFGMLAGSMWEYAETRELPDHVWAGVTVEHRRYVDRIDSLRRMPVAVRFLSIEPMLGPMPDLDPSRHVKATNSGSLCAMQRMHPA